MTPSRDWCIIMGDDLGTVVAETSGTAVADAARSRLCWSRGYILAIHGGGATPVAQTSYTNLNEHIRKAYGAKAAAHLINQMRGGVTVPKRRHGQCIDVMHDILSEEHFHLRAAHGAQIDGRDCRRMEPR